MNIFDKQGRIGKREKEKKRKKGKKRGGKRGENKGIVVKKKGNIHKVHKIQVRILKNTRGGGKDFLGGHKIYP